LLTESLVLSFVAGLLGCLLGYALTQLIVALLPQFYVPNETRVTMNGWVLFFTVGLSALAGIMTGLMPGFQCTRPNLNRALKEGSQGASSGERSVRTRNILVVTAIALSVVLLVGASLTIRGFAELYRHDWGFQPERLLLVRVPLPPHHYVTLRERNSFARDLLERTKLLPGVASVAYGFLPFHGGDALGYRLSGQPKLAGRTIAASLVSSDFRKTFGLTLKEGNDLTEQEVAHGEPVALISEAAAKLWPAGENPIGRMLELDALTAPSQPYNLAPAEPAKAVMVVGIVGDTRNANFRAEPLPAVYVPYTLRGLAIQQFVVRTQGFPMDLLPAFRGALRSLDKDLPLYRPITVDEIMGQQTTQPRFNMALFSGLGALALLLAATGIYSLLSFNVAQRTREIGVRMALGAEKHNIMQLIVRAGSRLLGIGMIIGLGGSFALTKIMKSQIVDLPSPGALDLIAVIIVLGIAALVASWLPARRAAKVDPVISLRAE
jgi:putative ABC transport system permease protein